MMNRAQRRAAAKQIAKRAVTDLRSQEHKTEAQELQNAAYQELQRAVQFQKQATELWDATQESLRWTPNSSAYERAREELESDALMLQSIAVEARQHTIECGIAFLEAIDPRPPVFNEKSIDRVREFIEAERHIEDLPESQRDVIDSLAE